MYKPRLKVRWPFGMLSGDLASRRVRKDVLLTLYTRDLTDHTFPNAKRMSVNDTYSKKYVTRVERGFVFFAFE